MQKSDEVRKIQIDLLNKVQQWIQENSINGKIEVMMARGYINYLILKLNGKQG